MRFSFTALHTMSALTQCRKWRQALRICRLWYTVFNHIYYKHMKLHPPNKCICELSITRIWRHKGYHNAIFIIHYINAFSRLTFRTGQCTSLYTNGSNINMPRMYATQMHLACVHYSDDVNNALSFTPL